MRSNIEAPLRNWAALAMALALTASTTGCVFVSVNPFQREYQMAESVLEPSESWMTTNRVLLVDVSGIIDFSSGGLFGPSRTTLETLKDELDTALEDDRIKALIVRINSPGGGVTASDLCYREIMEFKRKRSERDGRPFPVVAVMMDVAASGGYYVALAADEIWAHPTSVTGSIGVATTAPNIGGLAEKIGIGVEVIKSGDNKDMGSLWRALRPEERQILQELIDTMHRRFIQTVATGRPQLSAERIHALSDGRVFTADQARAEGLIDRVGYLDEAIASARARADIDDAKVITYVQGRKWKSNIYSRSSAPAAGAEAPQAPLIQIDAGSWLRPDGPRFHYLWLP